MKLQKKAGATSEIWQIFIADTSSTTGAGLTGLVFNTASLTAYYHRDTDTTATAITLVTMTVGTFTSSGFKEIDATNMPGWYQLCPPNAAIAAGAKSCAIHLKGATNMAPLPIEVQLTAVDVDSATAFMTSVATVTTVTNQLTGAQVATAVWQDTTAGDFTTASSIGKSLFTSGNVPGAASGLALVGSNVGTATSVSGAVGSVTGAVGSVTGAVGSVTGAVGSVTARVTANTDQLAGQTVTAAAGVTFPTSVASPTNITAGVITTVTNLTNAPTNGDLTATMKTSVTTAATAATPVAASVTGNIGGTLANLASGAKTDVENAVWNATMSSHIVALSTGAALNAAGSAGDPWITALPGAYGAGSAGAIIGGLPSAVTIAAAVQTSAAASPLPADVKKMNAHTVAGTGTAGDLWRG